MSKRAKYWDRTSCFCSIIILFFGSRFLGWISYRNRATWHIIEDYIHQCSSEGGHSVSMWWIVCLCMHSSFFHWHSAASIYISTLFDSICLWMVFSSLFVCFEIFIITLCRIVNAYYTYNSCVCVCIRSLFNISIGAHCLSHWVWHRHRWANYKPKNELRRKRH